MVDEESLRTCVQRKGPTRRWPDQQAHLAASHQIREMQSLAVGARASPTASVDSIPNRSQTCSANGPRSHGELLQCHATQTHRRCAPMSGRLLVVPCAILRILLTPGWDWPKCRLVPACLSAAVVRSTRSLPRRLSCAHLGSAAAPPPALPASIGCTAGRQRGVGVARPGWCWCQRGVGNRLRLPVEVSGREELYSAPLSYDDDDGGDG